METRFTAVFCRDGEWWAGYVEELPGANTQGRTLAEARENLKEAITMILDFNREKAKESWSPGEDAVREEIIVTT